MHIPGIAFDWKVDVDLLDAGLYLPWFVDGIREKKHPYVFIAAEGSRSLIRNGDVSQILSSLSQTVTALKAAFDTHDSATIMLALEVLRLLSTCSPDIGSALVEYYHTLIPVLRRFRPHQRNLGDQMDFAQFSTDGRLVGEAIEETLLCLYETGGPSAFAAIKSIVPTFEVV